MEFDLAGFSQRIREKRMAEKLGLREAAEKSNVSASTLSRVENGSMPDMDTFMNVCEWLVMMPSEFFLIAEGYKLTMQDRLEQEVDYRVDNAIDSLQRAINNLNQIRGNYRRIEKD